MKILVAASTFPSCDTDPVPAFVKDQVIALKEQYPDLQLSVLAPHDKRSNTKTFTQHKYFNEYRFHYFWPFSNAEKLAGRGIMPALQANPLNYLLIPFLFLGEFVALLRLTHTLHPDVIYAHWFTPQAVISRWVGQFTNTPFIFTTHASDVQVWHKIPLVGRFVVRSNTRKAQAFTAVSQRSMSKLEDFFSASEWDSLKPKSQIIPMGITMPRLTKTKDDNATKTILFMGRLAEKKGVQYLLPAFAKIHNQLKDYRLVIAGDGTWRDQLQQQARDLGIAKLVEFTGFASGKTKENLLVAASIFVVPSIVADSGDAEGLPVSLMEGMAYGKLCVATRESGADDILTHGKNGLLIDQKDTSALADALVEAATLDQKSQRAIQSAAVSTATQFAWPEIARRHYEFLFESTT